LRACRITIKNFRGIKRAIVLFPEHAVLIGDNNTGKTTVLEALDLVLGPDRLNRLSPIDEHDFFQGKYLAPAAAATGDEGAGAAKPATAVVGEAVSEGDEAEDGKSIEGEDPRVEIEVTLADLTEEQKGKFGDYIEFWDSSSDTFYEAANPAGVDAATITEALRITFLGWYDQEEDDFEGKTYFARSLAEGDNAVGFSKKDKQICGFLYLRSLRTASRALSLEHETAIAARILQGTGNK
jgi:putative ATP-dependent endonuclease of the OLD family